MLVNSGIAQTFSKRLDWNGQLEGEISVSIAPTPNGFILSRVGDQPDSDEWRFGFVEIDPNGNLVWENSFEFENTTPSFGGKSSGNYTSSDILIESGTINSSEFGNQVFLVRYTVEGDTIWTKRYGVEEQSYFGKQAIITNDGGYAITGYTDDFEDANDLEFCAFLLKYDIDGQFSWIEKYPGINANSIGLGISQNPDGDFIVSGSTNPLNEEVDHFVVFTNSIGEEIWRRQFGNPEAEGSLYGKFAADGNIILGGHISQNDSPVAKNLYLAKLSSLDGETMWESINESLPSVICSFNDSEETDEGDIISAGTTERPDPTNSFPIEYAVISKNSSDGDSIWTRKYAWNETEGTGGWIRDLIIDNEGSIICIGDVGMNEQYLSQDTWILKLDEFGCLIPDCQVGLEEQSGNAKVLVYPNPAGDSFAVQIELNQPSMCYLELYDITGQIVLSKELPLMTAFDPITIIQNTEFLNNGVYLIDIKNERGSLFLDTLIISK